MEERHAKGDIFNDPDWEKLEAPVWVPKRVRDEISRTGKPVDWGSGEDKRDERQRSVDNWKVFYRSRLEGEEILTHLLPGSAMPVKGWLRLISEYGKKK